MLNVKTYCPDGCKINIDGHIVEMMADKFLKVSSQRGFTLRLQCLSPSVNYLQDMIKGKSHKKVSVDIYVDISEHGSHIDVLDIQGEYILHSWSYELTTEHLPEYEFSFGKNEPIYN